MKKYYAGYNSYGIHVVGYHSIYMFDTASERDAWVRCANSTRDNKDVAEAITAKVAYCEMPCLLTGAYGIENNKIIENPNKRLEE